MKDETEMLPIIEFIGLRAKCYSLTIKLLIISKIVIIICMEFFQNIKKMEIMMKQK